jgi:hypothetical protein
MLAVATIVAPLAAAAWLVLLVAYIAVNRRYGIALRETYGWRGPTERYIEDGDWPMPSPAEFRWIANGPQAK